MTRETLEVPAASAGERLDRFLAAELALDVEEVRALVAAGRVRVRGRTASALRRLSAGDEVTIERPAPRRVVASGPTLDVLHDDASCLVVVKPAGLPVEPAGPRSESAVGAASRLGRFDVGGRAGPGLPHRLDRDTSGALLLARTDRALAALRRAFEEGRVLKEYLALVSTAGAAPPDQGALDTPYGRDPSDPRRFTTRVPSPRRARLAFRVERRLHGAALLRVRLETGRTHQIRVQLGEAGWPVLGDGVYGVPSPHLARQGLHAERLAFPSPEGREVDARAPLPEDLVRAIERLGP